MKTHTNTIFRKTLDQKLLEMHVGMLADFQNDISCKSKNITSMEMWWSCVDCVNKHVMLASLWTWHQNSTLDMIDIDTNNCIFHRFRLLSPIANWNNIFREWKKRIYSNGKENRRYKLELLSWHRTHSFSQNRYRAYRLVRVGTYVCYDCRPIYTIPSLVMATIQWIWF